MRNLRLGELLGTDRCSSIPRSCPHPSPCSHHARQRQQRHLHLCQVPTLKEVVGFKEVHRVHAVAGHGLDEVGEVLELRGGTEHSGCEEGAQDSQVTVGAWKAWGLLAPTWCQFSAERLIFLTELGCSLFISLGGGDGGELVGTRVFPPQGNADITWGSLARSSQLGMKQPHNTGDPRATFPLIAPRAPHSWVSQTTQCLGGRVGTSPGCRGTHSQRMTPSFSPFWKSAPICRPVTLSIHVRSSASFCGSYFWASWGRVWGGQTRPCVQPKPRGDLSPAQGRSHCTPQCEAWFGQPRDMRSVAISWCTGNPDSAVQRLPRGGRRARAAAGPCGVGTVCPRMEGDGGEQSHRASLHRRLPRCSCALCSAHRSGPSPARLSAVISTATSSTARSLARGDPETLQTVKEEEDELLARLLLTSAHGTQHRPQTRSSLPPVPSRRRGFLGHRGYARNAAASSQMQSSRPGTASPRPDRGDSGSSPCVGAGKAVARGG